MTDAESLEIETGRGAVRALALVPGEATWLYVFAHGAGAGMRHSFMSAAAGALAGHGIATLRYEYPYVSAGSRRPDPSTVLEAVTRAVVSFAADAYPALRIAAGGKSMGGRMTSRAQAAQPLPRTEALVFFGFPLHPPRRPATDRADHLAGVHVPMLFLQGTRDDLADLDLLLGVTAPLGARATVHVVDGADHGFAVLKRSGRTDVEVLAELARVTAEWLGRLTPA